MHSSMQFQDKENHQNHSATTKTTLEKNAKTPKKRTHSKNQSPSSVTVGNQNSEARNHTFTISGGNKRNDASRSSEKKLTRKKRQKQKIFYSGYQETPEKFFNQIFEEETKFDSPVTINREIKKSNSSDEIELYDEYGFIVLEGFKSRRREPRDLRLARFSLWRQILQDMSNWRAERRMALTQAVLEGIPMKLRPLAWKAFIGMDIVKFKTQRDKLYDTLKALPANDHSSHQIELDINRTYSNHRLFKEMGGTGQAQLFRILNSYSYFNPSVGYCQGMSFLGGVLLMLMSEEDSFWMLIAILERIGDWYTKNMAGLLRDSKDFNDILGIEMPTLRQHLERHGLDTIIFTSRWFLSLFTDLAEWETVLRIWDIFFWEGVPGVFRCTLGILKCCCDDLLNLHSIETLLPYVLNPPRERIEPSKLFSTMMGIDVHTLINLARSQASNEEKLSKYTEKKQIERINEISIFNKLWRKIVSPKKKNKILAKKRIHNSPINRKTNSSNQLQSHGNGHYQRPGAPLHRRSNTVVLMYSHNQYCSFP
eukprot:TRINITY_DN3287_c0_g2_i1.p1 TRINITY_DN3287_c0_g2~~TRINITY_DN3287_c0_g2_i1.p1  ORF type:complete len:538 (+),score=80.31 TRINITY_DN3287_c0_g2_i1:55-1668(+)